MELIKLNKTVIIMGSSRSNGETKQAVDYFRSHYEVEFIDLLTKNIGHYDYEYKNSGDDFLPTIREIVESYETLIFASPVYWYTMSGVMKDFFDRISDVLRTEKDTGRKLRGKNMAMISCSGADDLVNGFNMPFVESAKYLGMNYLGDVHVWVEDGVLADQAKRDLVVFGRRLLTDQNQVK